MTQVCEVAGCTREAHSQGMCAEHFTRALVYGLVRPPRQTESQTILQRVH